ncbi:MAG TPA: hypothetical protein VK524_04775 [Polyangiaceae bacterium]|nr:hypothetical protein [Polyangiaceae bacterium]
MKRLSPWIAASVVAFAASSGTYACGGDDDDKDGSGGTGTILEGGSGSGGRGGNAGDGGVSVDTQLARACATDNECGDGLRCVTADSLEFGGLGPPKGYCTADCSDPDAGGDEFCQAFAPGAICLNYGTNEAPALFCALRCEFGPPELAQFDPNKCHARRELACAPVFERTGDLCNDDPDCASGQICSDGECFRIIAACSPQCNSNADCGAGLFCDPLSGMCAETDKAGKPIGAACTQPQDGATDECRGLCISVVGDGDQPLAQLCTEFCTLDAVPSCGWGGPNAPGRAEAGCLFTSSAVNDNGGSAPGDRGLCGRLCDCNADCLNPGMVCLANSFVRSRYRRTGYCSTPIGEDGGTLTGIPSCTDAGAPRDAGPG